MRAIHRFRGRARAGALLALTTLGVACGPQAAPTSSANQRFGRAGGSFDGAQFLSSDSKHASAAGAGQSEVLSVEAGAPGDRISALFWVPTTECSLVIARASESVDDIDLFVYGDDGTVFGTDDAPDKAPSVLVCPPHPKRMFAVARVASGHGVVAVGAQRVAPQHAAQVRAAIARRAAERPAGRERARVQARLAAHRQELGGRWRELRRVALPADARVPTRASVALSAGHCLDVLAVPTQGVGALDLQLLDATGRIVGRGQQDGRDRFIVACSEHQTNLTLELRPRAGTGPTWLIVAESESGAAASLSDYAARVDLGSSAPLSASRATLEKSLESLNYGPTTVLSQGNLSASVRRSVAIPAAAGCRRIDAVGGAPLFGIRAWAYSDSGELVAQARGAGRLSMLLCGESARRLDIEATLSPGPFMLLSRAEPESPHMMQKHPLAASRLMEAVWGSGAATQSREVGGATAVTIAPARQGRASVRVPVQRCVHFFSALGPGARGLEMRLVDADSGNELARSHGAFVASNRLCAHKGTINARVELSAEAGATTALFATRMSLQGPTP